jgi:hypothetical protein
MSPDQAKREIEALERDPLQVRHHETEQRKRQARRAGDQQHQHLLFYTHLRRRDAAYEVVHDRQAQLCRIYIVGLDGRRQREVGSMVGFPTLEDCNDIEHRSTERVDGPVAMAFAPVENNT